jgi:hypothetical protein
MVKNFTKEIIKEIVKESPLPIKLKISQAEYNKLEDEININPDEKCKNDTERICGYNCFCSEYRRYNQELKQLSEQYEII